MTDREKAIVMAYTGICMLAGDKFQIFHKYVDDIMGRPVYIHEMATDTVDDEIKEKAKADFIALCKDEGSDVLDKIKAEVIAIAVNGQVDEHTMFVKTGEQVKQMVLEIIDKNLQEVKVQKLPPISFKEPCEMTAEEYRQRMIQAFHNADCDELIAICVLPTEKEFENLEWLLEKHYKAKPEPCDDCISRANTIDEISRIIFDHPLDGYEDGQLILKTIQDIPPVSPADDKCQECKKDWTKCGKCFVTMEWIKEHKSRAELLKGLEIPPPFDNSEIECKLWKDRQIALSETIKELEGSECTQEE